MRNHLFKNSWFSFLCGFIFSSLLVNSSWAESGSKMQLPRAPKPPMPSTLNKTDGLNVESSDALDAKSEGTLTAQAPAAQPAPAAAPQPPKAQTMAAPGMSAAAPSAKPMASAPAASSGNSSPSDDIDHGKDLVSIDFPNGVNLADIIKTIGVWSGKNFILGQGVSVNSKISIVAPEPMTKEEAYQTFLSALNISGFTTVETGKIVKVLPIATARTSNIKTYYGQGWAPATDEIINQVVPLTYTGANDLINQLRPVLGTTTVVPFSTTNSIVLTDTGFRIRRILEIIKLLDDKSSQAQVSIVPINYMDVKDANQKIQDIFGSRGGTPSLTLQKSLIDEKSNSLILVGPSRGLDDVVRFIQRIDKPVAQHQGTQSLIRVRPLDYADAEKLTQTLNSLAQGRSNSQQNNAFRPSFFPTTPGPQPAGPPGTTTIGSVDLSGVKITSDKPTNSLIVQGSKAAYDEIETLITLLDKRRSQVYLEANLLDLQIQNGLSWTPSTLGGATSGDKYMFPFGFNVGKAAGFTLQGNGTTDTFAKSLADLESTALLGVLSTKEVKIGGFSIRPGALLFALKNDTSTNVIQTPSMLVSDNEQAKFSSSEEYKKVFFSSASGGLGAVAAPQQYNVTTALTVTPQISRADFVNMKIELQLDDAGPLYEGYPQPISKRTANSVVTVQSSQTIVLGGITKDSTKVSEAKVPLLGDIPILGWLFKTVSNEKKKSNLALFLTPYVVRDSEDLSKIYEQKIKDRDEFLKIFYGKHYKEEEFYSVLPTLEEGKVPPPRPRKDDVNQGANNNPVRSQTLPSRENDPIAAPATGNGGVGVQVAPSGGGFAPSALPQSNFP